MRFALVCWCLLSMSVAWGAEGMSSWEGDAKLRSIRYRIVKLQSGSHEVRSSPVVSRPARKAEKKSLPDVKKEPEKAESQTVVAEVQERLKEIKKDQAEKKKARAERPVKVIIVVEERSRVRWLGEKRHCRRRWKMGLYDEKVSSGPQHKSYLGPKVKRSF